MFTGTTIDDLIATVERAEQHGSLAQMLKPETTVYPSLAAVNSKAAWENWAGVA
jgi:hypothetical protein